MIGALSCWGVSYFDGNIDDFTIYGNWPTITGTRQEPPGPIDNSILLQSDGAPKQGLKRGVDYRGVTKEVWDYFISIYSGGPSITRKRIDIYDPHYTPPEELLLGKK